MKVNFKNKILQSKFKNVMSQNEQDAKARMHPEAELPENFFKTLMDDQLSKGYLNNLGDAENWKYDGCGLKKDFGWLKFRRLPIRPGKEEENTLLESWQSALSACHTMNLGLALVLLRRKGVSEIYLGARAKNGNTERAKQQLLQCLSIHMPGSELEIPDTEIMEDEIDNLEHAGIVTGIPSLRTESSGVTLQTLDKIAKGINIEGKEKTYAMILLADPAKDSEIVNLQQNFLDLKSEIHSFIGHSTNESFSQGQSTGSSVSASLGLGMITEALALGSLLVGNFAGAAGLMAIKASGIGVGKNSGRNFGTSSSVNREYRNFIGKYCEDLIDSNINRFEQGRNLGFWQTGVYVLAEDDVTTDSVLGMLRSVYSGKTSYLEPIRVFNAGKNEKISAYIKNFHFLPLPGEEKYKNEIGESIGLENGWNILGRMYENFATAMTTEELSIAGSLPRREVAGLRMVKNGVTFANNSSVSGKTEGKIEMGKLVDMGVVQNIPYNVLSDALVRHILVCGITGSGKTTTCKKIINGVQDNGIPVMIIEPAKDDYVRWAIEQNKHLPKEKQYKIIMPGVKQIDGVTPEPLLINLFQPAAWKDSPVNYVQHAEMVTTLLNACLPSEDVIPVIIEEAVHECVESWADEVPQQIDGIDVSEIDNPQAKIYPALFDLEDAGERVINRKTYENRTKENFREILNTRFKYLRRGTRGKILNTVHSSDYEELFNRPVIINLSRLAGTKDKSLIMSLLLLALQEYRCSRYQYDEKYRKEAQKNKLKHLMVVEEAHNVLTKPSPMSMGSGNPQQAAADLFGNMLSEIRAYGQGMMIVDQVPTRLIDDALKNTNYKISHRMTSPDDVEVMAKAMILRPEQADVIPSLEIGNTIIFGDMDDSAAWVKITK